MELITILLISYLLGSIPTGFLIGQWRSGIDLRKFGSGSTGATNVLRHIGKWPALFVLIFDIGKGLCAVLISFKILPYEDLQVLAGLCSLAGHIWPVWLNWRGGKAVATALGVLLGLSWQVGLAALGIFLTVLSLSKIVSLSSLIAALSLPFLMILSFKSNFQLSFLIISIASMLMVFWRHRSNIKRLFNGTEPKINQSNSSL